MKRRILLLLILLVILAAGIAGVFFFRYRSSRKQQAADTVEATGPTLPVVYMQVDGTDVNEMFGIRAQIPESYERESVTPLTTEKKLSIKIDPKDSEMEGISYELTSIADESLVENGEITDLEKETDGTVTASFSVRSNLRSGQEYMLCFDLRLNSGEDVYYYTRLVQGSGIDFDGYLEFVSNFVSMCLDKKNQDELADYLETESTNSGNSFTDIDITSSTDMVTWGSLAPEMVQEMAPVICACNTTTVSIEQTYIVSASDSDGNTEYYKVRDYYRMKYADGTTDVALLNFKRNATLIFDSSLPVRTDTGLNLGVQGKTLTYSTSSSGSIVVFAENGDLWSYNAETGALTSLFTFREKSGGTYAFDDRTETETHDYAIEQVSDDGDVTFVLYGYMSSGSHEGQMGVAVFSYTAAAGTAQERLFIPLNQSYAVLKQSISRLSYVSSAGELYLFLGTELCKINLTDGTYALVQDSIDSDGFVSSSSQQVVAWLDQDNEGGSTSATVLDLESGKKLQITAPDGEGILSCGFINSDYVYGLVKADDVITGSDGVVVCGMYQLNIEDIDGNIKKTYQKDQTYVTAVTEEQGDLALTLSTLSDGSYKDAGTDHIVNNETESNGASLSVSDDSRTGQDTILTLSVTPSADAISQQNAKILFTATGSGTSPDWPESDQELYAVYGDGALQGTYQSVNRAIVAADAVSGLVLNGTQQYVWVRGDWPTSYTIDTTSLPEGFLNLKYDEKALGDLLGSDYSVLNLSGCTREELYYQLSQGYPVIAKTSDDSVYYVIGYDAYNIWIYDKSTGEAKAVATDDADALFEKNANQFLSYMKK